MAPILLAILFALSTHAALVTSAPAGGITEVVDAGSTCGGGQYGAFTVTANVPPVCFSTGHSFGLTDNGAWNRPAAGFGLIGINSATASFTLDLGASYASAGVFMNYPRPVSGAGPSIVAIASDGITVLESYNIEISAPIITPNGANAGAFRGISRPSADIRFLQVANSFAAVHSITVDNQSTAVPEPATFLLLAPALFYLLRRHNC